MPQVFYLVSNFVLKLEGLVTGRGEGGGGGGGEEKKEKEQALLATE